MKYRIVVTKVVKSTKDFEIEADGLDAMYKSEDADEVRNLANIEAINDDFSDAVTTIEYVMGGIQEVEENPYIDQYGEPYDPESGDSLPAGGGLDKRCDYNAEALFAYYAVKNRDDIYDYLKKRGFRLSSASANCDVFVKGNTGVWYESYADGMWGYMHTELVEP
jgi:hypothetical protein